MTNCNKEGLRRALNALVVLLAAGAATFAGCTSVDDTLGYDLLPENQLMSMRIDTFYGVQTYNTQSDTLRSSGLSNGYFGQMRNDTFGMRRSRFISQFVPSQIPYEKGFGLNPILDSVQLLLSIKDYTGDTTHSQRFYVHEVIKEFVPEDTLMYINFDPTPYIDPEPLFEFDFNSPSQTAVTLRPTLKGRSFSKRLMEADSATYYNDTIWVNTFKGLYIVPEQVPDGDRALYATTLSSSGLQLCMRDHDSTDNTLINDTIYAIYKFYDQTASVGNVGATSVEYDFTGSLASGAGINDTLPGSPLQATLYVEGMGGVNGYLRLSEEFVRALGTLQDRKEEGGFRIAAINQAVLVIALEADVSDTEQLIPLLDAAPARLGMYSDLKLLTGIPDYNYQYEYSIQQQSANYRLPYNGYVNRSNGYYAMDVTVLLQRMWKEWQEQGGQLDKIQNRSIFLAPDAFDLYTFGRVMLKGSGSDEPVKVVITYTLIK